MYNSELALKVYNQELSPQRSVYLMLHSSLLTTAPGKAHLSPEIVFKRKFEYLVSMSW